MNFEKIKKYTFHALYRSAGLIGIMLMNIIMFFIVLGRLESEDARLIALTVILTNLNVLIPFLAWMYYRAMRETP